MNTEHFVASLLGLMLLFGMPVLARSQSTSALDSKAIEQAMGKPGELKDDVYKVSLPRKDLSVSVKGIKLKSGFALGSWIAFKQAGNDAVMDGDLVEGCRIQVFYDTRPVFDQCDHTFLKAGHIGLWTNQMRSPTSMICGCLS